MRISSESETPAILPPAIARERRPSSVWLVGTILALAYGSLIPFDIDLEHFGRGILIGALRPQWGGFADALVNVGLYLPLGWVIVRLCAGQAHRASIRVWAAVGVGAAVSFLLELSQTAIASRVASWWDVLFNSFGAVGGALAAHVSLSVRIRKYSARLMINPLEAAVVLMTVGVFVANLDSFDFLRSTDEIRDAFLRASWSLSPDGLWRTASALPAIFSILFEDALWFGLLAFLTVFAYAFDGRRAHLTLIAAACHAVLVAILVELLQFFVASQSFELLRIVFRSLAALLGAWSGVCMLTSECRAARARASSLRLSVPALACMALILFAGPMEFWSALPTGGEATATTLRIEWIPFAAAWRGSFVHAVVDATSTMILYSVLVVSILMAARSRASRSSVAIAVGTALFLACASELFAATNTRFVVDVTHPMLALLAAAVGVRWFRQLLSSRAVPVQSH